MRVFKRLCKRFYIKHHNTIDMFAFPWEAYVFGGAPVFVIILSMFIT